MRIKIEAVDNYFFDVNDAAFALAGRRPPPETTITSGPDGRVDRAGAEAEVHLHSSSVTPATFGCTVDGEAIAAVRRLGVTASSEPGTHAFSVAAVNAAGVADPTPATVSLHGASRRQHLRAGQGAWTRKKDKRAMFDDYVTSRRKGAELVTRVAEPPSASCSSSATAKNGGIGARVPRQAQLNTVRFAGKQRFSQLRTFELRRARKGKLRIVVAKNKPVRIEGVAVVTTKKTG